MRGFWAIAYKEFIVVMRDRATLFFMFFPPLVQIVAFGFALDNDPKHLALLVYNEDRTEESRSLAEAFVSTGSFRVVGEVHSLDELASALLAGRATAGLEIPPDFSRRLRAGRNAQVQVIFDGSNSTPALQALNTAMGVAFRRSLSILLGLSGRSELPVEVTANSIQSSDEEPQLLCSGRDRHCAANCHCPVDSSVRGSRT